MHPGSAPIPPNPRGLIKGQQKANLAAATQGQALNATNQATPYGSQTWTEAKGPTGLPQWTLSTNLSPAQQALLDQQIAGQTTAGGLGTSLLRNASGYLTNPVDFSQTGIQGEIANLYRPEFNREQNIAQESLTDRLHNQGLWEGSTGFDNALHDFESGWGSSWANVLGGAQDQAMKTMEAQQQFPITVAQELSQWGAPTNPTFGSTPQTSVANTNTAQIAQNAYNQQLNRYQTQQAQNNALMGGLAGLGGAAIQAAPFFL